MKATKKPKRCILCGSARPDFEALYVPKRTAEYGGKAVRYRMCARHRREQGWMAKVEHALKDAISPNATNP